MAGEFHELINVTEVGGVGEFVMERSKALHAALVAHRDFSVVRLLKRPDQGNGAVEFIIIDAECDEVPPKNPHGIEYRERLALCVPENPKRLIEVLALREGFPILIHQNNGSRSGPASLCLYFEPAESVHRTWTPQKFLRQIQWWLGKSAKGDLHPADQPVEHLFFSSKYELVLPWYLSKVGSDPSQRFVINCHAERPDHGITWLLRAVAGTETPKAATAAYVEITVPPVVHGFVERDPVTFDELSDLLSERGIDFLPLLQTELLKRISPDGAPVTNAETFVVVLIRIPIRRDDNSEPIRVGHRAFLAHIGVLKLGVATGALMELDGKYYSAKGIINPEPCNDWRSEPIFALDVLYQNDSSAARWQSGIKDAGPGGVLVGAGSLGSALLNLWGRSGWGNWTVVDNDHIKPHNLSRHVAYWGHVGQLKANVVAELHGAATGGASVVTALVGDACELSVGAIEATLKSAQLAIDASTTLEYPRLASTAEGLTRHMSVFLTPDGASSVLLAEDAERSIRLRTLEAQYYRALIREPWGAHHLDGNQSTFWSGAGCRDISTVMPYSRITAHASTLAEQVMAAQVGTAAMIRVWQREPENGAVSVRDVAVHAERCFPLGEFNLYIDHGVEARVRELREAQGRNETGGVLLGYHDFNVKAIVIVDALPAPADSKGTPGSFERGIAELAQTVNEASRRTAGVVGYVGEWHSHPPGHSASPSRDDIIQLVHLAFGMQEDGLPGLQLIVGEGELQVLHGTVKE